MSANCLVTKLKASVDIDAPKLGYIKIHLLGGLNETYRQLGHNSAHKISLISGELTLKITETGEVINLPAEIPANTNLTYITGNNGAVIEISDKYNIDNLSVFGMTSDTISTKEFVFNKPIYFLFNQVSQARNNIIGNWNDIINKPTSRVSSIDIQYSSKINGELKDFARWCPDCVSISLNGSAITGSIEEYIQILRTTNRTRPNSIDFTPGETNVTFNGESVSLSAPGNITWTDNTITYNGVTVDA